MNSNRKEFNVMAGSRLRKVRRNMGYTQAEMAEKLDIGVESFRKLELGFSGLTAERLNSLYIAFRISPDYIVTGIQKENITYSLEEYLTNCGGEEQMERALEIMNMVLHIMAGKSRKF